MKIKIALSMMFLIALSAAGMSCGSSKADKITGPSTLGSSNVMGNAIDMWSSKNKIGVGETATITTKVYNTDGYPLSGLPVGGCNDANGINTDIAVEYSINVYGNFDQGVNWLVRSATIKGATSSTCSEGWSAYYFNVNLNGLKAGTAAITATHSLGFSKTIYVDIE